MKQSLLLALMAIGLIFINACEKESDDSKPDPTNLQITLADELGNPVPGAAVKLFASQTDWASGTNQVGSTQFSDASGIVNFNDVSNIKYYWFAEKDCKNNVNGSVTTVEPLTKNVTNTTNSVLTSTGILKFDNKSTNPYRVYINGTAVFDMAGGTIEYKYYVPIGSYSVRVLQLSGYVLFPTDQTYTGMVTCGQTLTVTFP